MASLGPGKRVANRYVLLERLGDGGHAEVWAALDEPADRRVALKFMHLRNFSAGEATLILRHEAQMVQRLKHPGVLPVDEPERDGGLVFLPMEYAGGGDAAQLRGASWQRVLPVLLDVATVLEHAHSRGVVHRDIKPGNILFDDTGAVRVTDFGTASRMGSTLAMSAGSPFSASPQQLRGDAASTADDVYGLGALAYDLLTRHPPFYPDFDLQRVQRENPPRPVPVQAAPESLLDLIQSMLAREPHARPNLRQVMQGLQQFVSSGAEAQEHAAAPIVESAQPVTPARMRPRRYGNVALWLIAAAGIGGAAVLLLPSRVPDRQARIAEVLLNQRNTDDLARGALLENGEQWNEAVAHYQAMLARDASVESARDGLARSSRRVTLDRELAQYLARPERLSEPAVRKEAQLAMARGEATIPRTQRLADQLTGLRAALRKQGDIK